MESGRCRNHDGHWSTAYGTAGLKTNDEVSILWDEISTPMRLMLAQRWIWYGKHRNTDMICDFQDWDSMPKSLDMGSFPDEYDKVIEMIDLSESVSVRDFIKPKE